MPVMQPGAPPGMTPPRSGPMPPMGAIPRPPKGVVGGPQGPGGSPMVQPGTGEGMKARALQSIKTIMENLLKESRAFEAGSPELKTILRAASDLNALFNTKKGGESATPPPPVPPVQPGAGLGGVSPQALTAALGPGGGGPGGEESAE